MARLAPTAADPQASDRGVKSSSSSPPGAAAVLAAAVDYLTCTAGEPASADLMRAIGWGIVYQEAEAGNDLRPWAWKGYDGITAGGSSVGVRHDGCIVRLSGGCAGIHWLRPVQLASHVSRFDLAVTVRLPSDANPARAAYLRPEPTEERRRGRQVRTAAHIETWTEGETTYLGSRQSARFGRIYNKGLESGEAKYRDAWRWEVEFKGDTATSISRTVAECGDTSEAALAYVWDAFASWGCPPVWGRGADIPLADLHRSQTDDGRRLAWLATQVRPVVSGLLRRGNLAAVLSALGLDSVTEGT